MNPAIIILSHTQPGELHITGRVDDEKKARDAFITLLRTLKGEAERNPGQDIHIFMPNGTDTDTANWARNLSSRLGTWAEDARVDKQIKIKNATMPVPNEQAVNIGGVLSTDVTYYAPAIVLSGTDILAALEAMIRQKSTWQTFTRESINSSVPSR